MGGYAANGAASATVFAFNPATQQWTARQPMLAPTGALVLVEHSGKIYAIGGVRGGAAATTNEAYDPATNTWAALAPMPTAREHLAAAAIGDRIYVVGGRRLRDPPHSKPIHPPPTRGSVCPTCRPRAAD